MQLITSCSPLQSQSKLDDPTNRFNFSEACNGHTKFAKRDSLDCMYSTHSASRSLDQLTCTGKCSPPLLVSSHSRWLSERHSTYPATLLPLHSLRSNETTRRWLMANTVNWYSPRARCQPCGIGNLADWGEDKRKITTGLAATDIAFFLEYLHPNAMDFHSEQGLCVTFCVGKKKITSKETDEWDNWPHNVTALS